MTKVQKSILHDKVRDGNRIAVPANLLESMDLRAGDPIKIVYENGCLTISKRVPS